jgi:phosphatidylserine decarboxylase
LVNECRSGKAGLEKADFWQVIESQFLMTERKWWFPLALVGWQYWLPILFGGCVLSMVIVLILPAWLGIIPAVITLACLLFFRDPPRAIPREDHVLVSPADGLITEIAVVQSRWLPGDVIRMSIFLSVLDVHINRSPCHGTIHSIAFEPGQFLDARHPEAAIKNQSNNMLIDTSYGRIAVRQIVGAIARRIICPVHVGDHLLRGQCFGMIAFGSRTELIITNPDQWKARVKVGQKVRAGSTVVFERSQRP